MKKLTYFALWIVVVSILPGCGTAVVHSTPSGRPEVTIRGKVGNQARSEITNLLLNKGYNIKSASDYVMVFDRPVDDPLGATIYGSRYDSTPSARATIAISETTGSTRVVATFQIITNPGSAFERVTAANNFDGTQRFQAHLNEIKRKIESGG